MIYLRSNWGDSSARVIGEAIGRGWQAVQKKAQSLGLKHRVRVSAKVNVESRAIIREWIGKIPITEIASMLGVGRDVVNRMARRMGISDMGRYFPVHANEWRGGVAACYGAGSGIRIAWTKDEYRRLRDIKEGRVVIRERNTATGYMGSNWLRWKIANENDKDADNRNGEGV